MNRQERRKALKASKLLGSLSDKRYPLDSLAAETRLQELLSKGMDPTTLHMMVEKDQILRMRVHEAKQMGMSVTFPQAIAIEVDTLRKSHRFNEAMSFLSFYKVMGV